MSTSKSRPTFHEIEAVLKNHYRMHPEDLPYYKMTRDQRIAHSRQAVAQQHGQKLLSMLNHYKKDLERYKKQVDWDPMGRRAPKKKFSVKK